MSATYDTTEDIRRRFEADEKRIGVLYVQQTVIGQLLTEILAELKRGNSIERTGAVSSAEVHDVAPTKDRPDPSVQCTTKAYAGSEVPVEEAVEAHARLKALATERLMAGWQPTIDAMRAGR